MQEKRNRILDEALKIVPFDGWSDATLQTAARLCGLPEHYERVAFKDGVLEAIELFHHRIDRLATAELDMDTLHKMKIRERIFSIINTRLKVMAAYKPIIRKNMQFCAMPQNICFGTKLLWEVASNAWYTAGDNATDFNHYTKRATLIAVYSSTLLHWLEDESAEHLDSSAFLRRRIENVMQFEKLKSKIKSFVKTAA